jgi:GDP-L-fucose synthase
MDKNSKIYVAGHRGLVGSAIVKNLKEDGFTNIVVRSHKDLDLINTEAVAQFFQTEKPKYVFLAAAKVGGIVANNTYRADFIYENLMIQNNVIHQAYKNKVEKLLFLGSTCIYPKECPQPMKEEYLLTDTLEYTNEPYAIAKIAGIKMCESYNIQYGTNFISVMPTNLYGPNDNFDLEKSHVLPALIRKVLLGKALEEDNWAYIKNDLNKLPIKGIDGIETNQIILETLAQLGIRVTKNQVEVEIWGSGKPKREFLWSEDMADASVFIMKRKDFKDTFVPGTTEIRNTHINIGTGSDITIADLAVLIKNTVCFKGTFVFNTNKPDGTIVKRTDVTKLKNMGWTHKISIQEGVKAMCAYYTR